MSQCLNIHTSSFQNGDIAGPNMPRGLSLVEVIISATILSIAVLGITSAFTTSEQVQYLATEEGKAIDAAKEVLEEMRATVFADIYNTYQGMTRAVEMAGTNQRLGINGVNELEVIIVNSEMPSEDQYGRDLDGDGSPDGIDINQNGSFSDSFLVAAAGQTFPMHLDGDETLEAGLLDGNTLRILPVVVLVRWQSVAGMERRIELFTFITDRGGNL